MSDCCSSSEHDASNTDPGSEALDLLEVLKNKRNAGLVYGYQDAILTGCADANNAKWKFGSIVTDLNQSFLIRSDLYHATHDQTNEIEGLEPALYGFDFNYLTDLKLYHDLGLPAAANSAALGSIDWWPFGDLAFDNGNPNDNSNTNDFSLIETNLNNLHRTLLRIIHNTNGVITFGWHALTPLPLPQPLPADIKGYVNSGRRGSGNQTVNDIGTFKAVPKDTGAKVEFSNRLTKIAKFANSCTVSDDSTEKIPIIFRPYHEMNLGYFWWDGSLDQGDYRWLFDETVKFLSHQTNEIGTPDPTVEPVDNMLYCYAPNAVDASTTTKATMMSVYADYEPSKYDILGLDAYPKRLINTASQTLQQGFDTALECVKAMLDFAATRNHKPVTSLAEFGLRNLAFPVETNPSDVVTSFWDINVYHFLSAIYSYADDNGYDYPAYLLLWKNLEPEGGTDVEFYNPYLGHSTTPSFLQLTQHARLNPNSSNPTLPNLLFLKDM